VKCSEFESQITRFFDNQLKTQELVQFLSHVNQCTACKEELSIQYLVEVGIKRLEDGDNFDLNGELVWLLDQADRNVRIAGILKKAFILLCVFLAVIIMVIIIMAVI